MDAATSLVGTQIGSTLLAVGGMQVLKKWKAFPLLQEGATKLNRFVSVLVAGLISLGIHITFTGSASAGWSGTFVIPSLYQIAVGLFHWASQFIYQETSYTALQGLQALATLAKTVATIPGTWTAPEHEAVVVVPPTAAPVVKP